MSCLTLRTQEESLSASAMPTCQKHLITSFVDIELCTFLDYQYFVD